MLAPTPLVMTDGNDSLESTFFRPLFGAGADSLVKESGDEAPESLPPVSRPPPGRPRLLIPRFDLLPLSWLLDLLLFVGSFVLKSAKVGAKGSDTLSAPMFGVYCTFKLPPSSDESKGLLGTLFDSFSTLRFFSSHIVNTKSLDWASSLETMDSVSPKLLFPLGVLGPFRLNFRLRSCCLSLSLSPSTGSEGCNWLVEWLCDRGIWLELSWDVVEGV